MPQLGSKFNGVFLDIGSERTVFLEIRSTRPGTDFVRRSELRLSNREARKLAKMLLASAEQSDKDEDRVAAREADKKSPGAKKSRASSSSRR
jgi:hypothetical protein